MFDTKTLLKESKQQQVTGLDFDELSPSFRKDSNAAQLNNARNMLSEIFGPQNNIQKPI